MASTDDIWKNLTEFSASILISTRGTFFLLSLTRFDPSPKCQLEQTSKVLNFFTRWNCWPLNICSFIRGLHAQAPSDSALEINVGVAASVDATSDHITKCSINHTEAIVTDSQAATEHFVTLSDCAAVMVNTSTRFTDGEQVGFGTEIGIPNQKLHARGSVRLVAMATTTWIMMGTGQIPT